MWNNLNLSKMLFDLWPKAWFVILLKCQIQPSTMYYIENNNSMDGQQNEIWKMCSGHVISKVRATFRSIIPTMKMGSNLIFGSGSVRCCINVCNCNVCEILFSLWKWWNAADYENVILLYWKRLFKLQWNTIAMNLSHKVTTFTYPQVFED